MIEKKEIDRLNEKIRWQDRKLQIYENLVEILTDNIKIDEYLVGRGYKRLGIYGLGRIGRNLFQILYNSECEIVFVMDNTYSKKHIEYQSVRCIDVGEEIPNVDIMIITAPEAEELFKNDYSKIYHCTMITMEDLFFVL